MILKSTRIWWNLTFKRKDVKKSLMERHERYPPDYCIQCHACCTGCPALTPSGKCGIWDQADYRCKNYPFFAWELEKSKHGDLRSVCRYTWEDKP